MDVQELQRLVLEMKEEARSALANGNKKPEWACQKLRQTMRDLLRYEICMMVNQFASEAVDSFLAQLRNSSRSLRTKGIGDSIVNVLMAISGHETDNEVVLTDMKEYLDESWPSIEVRRPSYFYISQITKTCYRDLTSVLEIIREINDLQVGRVSG